MDEAKEDWIQEARWADGWQRVASYEGASKLKQGECEDHERQKEG